MTRIFYVPGLVYSGETDAQAADRDKRIAEYNSKVEAFEKKCRQPMKAYQKWAKKRGLVF